MAKTDFTSTILNFFNPTTVRGGHAGKKPRRRSRVCRIEVLEERELLAVTTGDFDAIKSQYADLNLADYGDYEIKEFIADSFTESELRNAINNAARTEKSDMIVIRTSSETSNTLKLSSGELLISVNAAIRGNVIIVGWGTDDFTIDAEGQSRVFRIGGPSNVALAGLTITGGASDSEAIYNTGTLTVTHCTITGNAQGIDTSSTATMTTVINSTIAGNSSIGISNASSDAGTASMTVINSMIADNAVGISNSGIMDITNCTIAGNSQEGIANTSSAHLTINNTLVAMNFSDAGNADISNASTATISGNNNLIGNGTGQTMLIDGEDGNIVGTSSNPIDPMFVNMEGSDWTQWDLRVYADSPAVDSGNNDLAIDAQGSPLLTDLVGNPRIENEIVDIGAYEDASNQRPKLPAPTGVTVEDGEDTITVSWTAVDNANGYEIQYSTDEEFKTGVESFTVTDTSATSGALPAGTYFVRVRAIGGGEYSNSDWSVPQSITIEGDPTLLLAPELFYVAATGITIDAFWSNVENASGYTVQCALDEEFTMVVRTYRTFYPFDTSATFPGLDEGTTYYVRVMAIGMIIDDVEYKDSDWSNVRSARTAVREEASTVVTSLSDTVNLYDNVITLREAIAYAGTNDLGMTITFAEWLYGQTIRLDGDELYIDKDITIDATGMYITINANQQSRVFTIAAGATVALEELAVTGGYVGTSGGGINNFGTLTMSNCTIAGNFAANSGGGINNRGTLTISDCMITSNESGNRGGGISNAETLVVTNCTIAGNSSMSMGGGVFNQANATLTNCIVAGNVADSGGGIFLSQGSMTVTSCTIAGNAGYGHASNRGGGIWMGTGNLTINDTIVAQNISSINGDIDCGSVGTISGSNNLIGDGSVLYRLGNAVVDSISLQLNQANGNVVGTKDNPIDPQFVSFTPYKAWEWTNYLWWYWDLHIDTDSSAKGVTLDLDGKLKSSSGIIDMGANNAVPVKPKTTVDKKATTINSVTLTWKLGAKNKDYTSANYIVTCITVDNTALIGKVVIVNGKATVVITGLNPGTKYKFSIVATNGTKEKAATVTATTTKYTAVKSLKSTVKTADSITLSWKPSTAKVETDGYIVEVYDATGRILVETITVSETDATVTGLDAKTKYTFVIKAAVGNQLSIAAKIKVTTLKEVI